MTTQAHSPRDNLSAVISAGGLTEDALHAITGIPTATITRFLREDAAGMVPADVPRALADDESRRVALLSAQLSVGMSIDDDERLRGILETLTVECRLTPANIAQLAGLALEDIQRALLDPSTIPLGIRYSLALRTSYIITAVNLARRR